jgi:hypothetical protein
MFATNGNDFISKEFCHKNTKNLSSIGALRYKTSYSKCKAGGMYWCCINRIPSTRKAGSVCYLIGWQIRNYGQKFDPDRTVSLKKTAFPQAQLDVELQYLIKDSFFIYINWTKFDLSFM